MSDIGQLVAKAKELVSALGSAPLPSDHPFVRNARPFAVYAAVIGLNVIGFAAVYLHDAVTAGLVVTADGLIVRELARFRREEKQAAVVADADVKKSVTAAAGQGGA